MIKQILENLNSTILGKKETVKLALCCLISKGHLLIEDVPGVGKTSLAKALADNFALNYARIQCTNDVLPSDILGYNRFKPEESAIDFFPGPIFNNIVLIDEINRSSPRTQSALLEAMEENSVTIDGETKALPSPFFVIATQNPKEHVGTFELPESQLDRFLMRINIGYPDKDSEKEIIKKESNNFKTTSLTLNTTTKKDITDLIKIQEHASKVFISDLCIDYIYNLVNFTRTSNLYTLPLSPRAGISISVAAKSMALINGRNEVYPEDVKEIFDAVVSHRLNYEESKFESESINTKEIIDSVPIPL